MRALLVIAILTAGLAVTAAEAADLRAGAQRGRYVTDYEPIGRRAPGLLVYDYEPGVVTRAYWLPPWRQRHYFPFGLAKWERHRTHIGGRAKPAKAFRRYWSTSDLYAQPGPGWDVDAAPLPLLPPLRR